MNLLNMLNNIKMNIAKFLCILFVFAVAGGCSCTDRPNSDKTSIVTVIFPQYDLARAVAGDKAKVTMLTKPGAEIHSFEPSLSDIKAIMEADVFVYGGGESDIWVDEILDSLGRDDLITVRLMDYAELLEEENALDKRHSHEEHSHGEGCENHESYAGYDEHTWTSPKNHIRSLEAVCDALCSADAVNTAYYTANKEAYSEELNKVNRELEAVTQNAEQSFIAVGDRFPFLYLAHDYGLTYRAVFPGCSHENDASPSVMIDTIEDVKHHNVKAIFKTETSDGRIANTISEETGVGVLTLYSCQSISPEDFESGVTYAELMRRNVNSLKEALN